MLNKELFGVLKDINILKVKRPKIKWVNGVPGCGKTTYVINNHCPPGVDSDDLVLTITKEGAKAIQERIRQKYSALPQSVIRANYRTVASYLLHGSGTTFRRVFVDEALMIHAGAIGFVCAISKCDEIVMLGDVNQIPYTG